MAPGRCQMLERILPFRWRDLLLLFGYLWDGHFNFSQLLLLHYLWKFRPNFQHYSQRTLLKWQLYFLYCSSHTFHFIVFFILIKRWTKIKIKNINLGVVKLNYELKELLEIYEVAVKGKKNNNFPIPIIWNKKK